jgi:hypothetical protein
VRAIAALVGDLAGAGVGGGRKRGASREEGGRRARRRASRAGVREEQFAARGMRGAGRKMRAAAGITGGGVVRCGRPPSILKD